MALFAGGERTLVGLDIGAYSIKLAHFVPAKPFPQLVALGSVRTPPGAIQDGAVVDPEQVAQAIQSLVRACGVNTRRVATAVGGPRVVARAQAMPPMSMSKLRTSVMWEAEKYIAFSVEESIVEPQVLQQRETEQGPVQDVMVVAAQRQLVDGRVAALEAAGLNVCVVDVEAFALMRSIVYGTNDPDVLQRTVAIVRLGETYGDITIVRRGSYVLSRPLPVAGATITAAVARALNVDDREAERIKEERGVAASPDDLETLPEEDRRVAQAINPLLDELGRELRLSLNFFQAQFQDTQEGANVDKILLVGGSAHLRGLDSYLSRLMHLPVEVRNIFDHLSVDATRFPRAYLRGASPAAAVAVGLALTPLMQAGSYPFATDHTKFGVVLQRRPT